MKKNTYNSFRYQVLLVEKWMNNFFLFKNNMYVYNECVTLQSMAGLCFIFSIIYFAAVVFNAINYLLKLAVHDNLFSAAAMRGTISD